MDHQNRFRLARSLTTIDVEAVAPASKARYSGLLVEQESEMRVNGGVLTSGVLRMVFAAILASTVSASAAEPRHISDPNKFCEEVLSTISSKALGKTVGLIAASTGQPDSSTGALANTLQ